MLPGGRTRTSWSSRLTRLRHGVPVLMYHLVAPQAPAGFASYTVSPSEFARQVRTMARLRMRTVSPEDLLAARDGGPPLPRRSVVITFDDGFVDCLRHAAPVLHEHGFTATMYVVAGLLGRTSRWLTGEGVDLPLVSAGDARELEQAGVRCESHSMTHPRLATLATDEIRTELRRSRTVLEDTLGHEVRHVAYPHGSCDERVEAEALEAGYRSGCTTRPARALSRDRATAIPRVKVDGRDGAVDFVGRVVTGKDAGYPVRRLTGRSRG